MEQRSVFRNAMTEVGKYAFLAFRVIAAVFGRWPKGGIVIRQFYLIGNKSLPIVLGTGAFAGLVLAVETYHMLAKVNFETMIGAIIAVSILRELGPVLVALMFSGRVGAAIAAELGTMKVTEQIDAMRTLSADPVKYLVLPRFLACIVMLPILTLMADCIAVISGYTISVHFLGISDFYYIKNTREILVLWDLMSGLIKSFVFGGIIATTSCYMGLNADSGAEGVGKATMNAVVTSCVLVLAADFLLALLM